MLNTHIGQLQEVEVGPVAAFIPSGRQEPTMEEGVLSRSHNHHRPFTTHRHQISTLHPLVHSPQNSDYLHLLLLISSLYKDDCPTSSCLVSSMRATDSLLEFVPS
ncbi:hypothetical protein QQF64_020525 [Cirrhinus molitorella]|uniref:Uncharacterized protein n=1 Tax=Cirrhinus molitorella TaxID=172907 RepID=A0ABR3LAW9_9TELE